jgi:hypothetical protein
MSEDEPVRHCTVDGPTNLRAALDAAAIEYLDVDDHRTIIIYQSAILMVIVTEGEATAAQSFDIEFWKAPPNSPGHDPDVLFAAFIEELMTIIDRTRINSE